jgi:hypothetical protein
VSNSKSNVSKGGFFLVVLVPNFVIVFYLCQLWQLRAASTSSTPPLCTRDHHGGLLCWTLRWECLVVHAPLYAWYCQHRCVPSSLRCFRAWQTRECLACWLLTTSTPSSTTSMCCCFCLRRLLCYATIMVPPHLPALYVRLLTLSNLNSSMPTMVTLCMTFSTLSESATIYVSYSQVFTSVTSSAPRQRSNCWGCESVGSHFWLLLQSHHLWCSCCHCRGMRGGGGGGDVRVFLVVVDIHIINYHM